MKKTIKVLKMINQNGLQVDNYTMVIRLKKIIQQLNIKIRQQDQQIMQLKRDSKTTKINQMQVEIQHLNDQNKRLTIMIQQLKYKHKQQKMLLTNNYLKNNNNNNITSSSSYKLSAINTQSDTNKTDSKSIFVNDKKFYDNIRPHTIKKHKKSPNSLLFGGMSAYNFNTSIINNHKKSYPEVQKQKEQQLKQQLKQKKFQKKYFQLLQQTQKLKKQLINIKLNDTQSVNKKPKSFNSTNSHDFDKTCNSFIQKNIQSLERMTQKKNDLEVQNDILKTKLSNNDKRMIELERENQQIKAVLMQLQAQIKRKNLLNSEKRQNKKMPTLFMDLSNNSTMYDV